MKKIGLTGGMGTGKTYISKHFIDMGIPVFYADDECKKMYKDSRVKEVLRGEFGDVFFTNDEVDLRKLSEFIFNYIPNSGPKERRNRTRVEKIMHSFVLERFDEWCNEQQDIHGIGIVMFESAIIFEAGIEKLFDKIIVVDAHNCT